MFLLSIKQCRNKNKYINNRSDKKQIRKVCNVKKQVIAQDSFGVSDLPLQERECLMQAKFFGL